jgi:putative alpha-1,2-mannosidase
MENGEIYESLPTGTWLFKGANDHLTKNCSKKNKYIQSTTLNGKELNRPFVHHTDIVQGGKLQLVVSARPNKNWGSKF